MWEFSRQRQSRLQRAHAGRRFASESSPQSAIGMRWSRESVANRFTVPTSPRANASQPHVLGEHQRPRRRRARGTGTSRGKRAPRTRPTRGEAAGQEALARISARHTRTRRGGWDPATEDQMQHICTPPRSRMGKPDQDPAGQLRAKLGRLPTGTPPSPTCSIIEGMSHRGMSSSSRSRPIPRKPHEQARNPATQTHPAHPLSARMGTR